MSPEERQAIAQLGLGSADELERIVQLADQARNAGRRTPREVRAYILRTRNVLGAQTPEQLQIERLLVRQTSVTRRKKFRSRDINIMLSCRRAIDGTILINIHSCMDVLLWVKIC